MQCPFCGQDDDKVVDSRSSEGGRVVRRRRECQLCRKRFTTYERPEDSPRLTLIKKDGTREPYEREKIIVGLRHACRKTSVGEEMIRRITDQTEEAIFRECDREVKSSFIGDVVAGFLREADKVAYVRFASVYREFADVGELIAEAREVKDAPLADPGQKDLFGGAKD